MRIFVIHLSILFITAVSTIGGTNTDRLAQMPLPQNNFELEKYLGDWYVQGVSVMCSWKGVRKFTDYFSSYQIRPDNKLLLLHTWRSLECSTAAHRFKPTDVPGKFILIDNIGDLITGENIVVATDYKTLAVKWGCTKRSVLGDCDDPYIVLKTRKRFPHKRTWQIIRNIIFDNWGLAMSDLKLFTQFHPC